MASEINGYGKAVEAIKAAILQAQYAAAKSTNAQQLRLYYAIGSFVSDNTRCGRWGSGALKAISEQLQREMPGLRGFSGRNLYYMKTFYEEWSNSICPDGVSSHSFAVATAKSSADPDLSILQSQLQNL